MTLIADIFRELPVTDLLKLVRELQTDPQGDFSPDLRTLHSRVGKLNGETELHNRLVVLAGLRHEFQHRVLAERLTVPLRVQVLRDTCGEEPGYVVYHPATEQYVRVSSGPRTYPVGWVDEVCLAYAWHKLDEALTYCQDAGYHVTYVEKHVSNPVTATT